MFGTDYNTVEDFLMDDTFAEWAAGCKRYDSFWCSYMEEFPAKAEVMQQAIEIICAFRFQNTNQPSDEDISEIIEKVTIRIAALKSATPVAYHSWLKIYRLPVAAIFLIVLFFVAYFYAVSYSVPQYVEQITTNGYRTVINHSPGKILARLPDQSSVVLNPSASLKFPVVFSLSKREVWLSGEAFFEITKNPDHPFFVYSKDMKVRVLGTSFRVRANPGDKTFQVIVSTGKVSVYAWSASGSAARESIVLAPNQAVLFHRTDARLQKAVLKHPSLLSRESTQKHFRFQAAPFSEVVAALELAYGINIIYNEKEMNGCPLTASLIEGELNDRLNLICKAVEASYTLQDGNIVINGKGCN